MAAQCSGSFIPIDDGDRRAPVAALGDIAVVAEAIHQLAKTSPILGTPHPDSVGLPEKPKPGSDGAMTWKASPASPPWAVGLVKGSMTLWNSTIDPGQPCVIRSGIAFFVWRSGVNEMDVDAVDVGRELIEAIERGLASPPVVAVGPVGADLLHIRERYSLRPVVDQLRFGPSRVVQTALEIVEQILRHVDAERGDLIGHARSVEVERHRCQTVHESVQTGAARLLGLALVGRHGI